MSEPSASVDGWDLFAEPIFKDPKARALSRVGVIDVGSNSVRMVVFDGAARSPAYFYNEKIMCGLGKGLAESGYLNPSGRERALVAMRRFAMLARTMDVAPLTAVATAAVREAKDGAAFVQQVFAETGLHIRIIQGDEEARLSAQGIFLGWPQAQGLVCDIGGSSMELAELSEGDVGQRFSARLGPLKLASHETKAQRKDEIETTLMQMRAQFSNAYDKLYLVGGSWRAIARIDMERRAYPLHVLHDYRMTPKNIRETAQYIALQDLQALRLRVGLSEARISLLPIACEVLLQLVKTFKPKEVIASSFGIREGMLYDAMPEKLRKRDPLIESARFSESKDARLPGFGRSLYQFIMPLFPKAELQDKRLMKAACLLHDVSWRAHPDYRADICFDNATRAALGGMSHRDRVFLGVALLYRYRNRSVGAQVEQVLPLLSEKDVSKAEILGRAMRFGAMFSGLDEETMGHLQWLPRKSILKFHLPKGPNRAFYGEVAAARFKSLAIAMNATDEVLG